MNPIIQWLQKEAGLLLKNLITFSNYYTMRDRIPFYATAIYILNKINDSKILSYFSAIFLIIAGEIGALSIYYIMTRNTDDTLTGFHWGHYAPIQYAIQIFALAFIGWKFTHNLTYSIALGFNGASATGYIYEVPFWFFTVKYSQAHLIHSSPRYVFFIDYQIIAIGVYIWLLKQHDIVFNKKDIIGFLIAWGITFIMASQMYVWETRLIVRIPLIMYVIYLATKLGEPRP